MGITGNIEVITGSGPDAENRSTEVFEIDPADVPRFVDVLFQLTDVQPDPTREDVVGAWTAMDSRLRPVTILLHEQIPFDATAIGQALATALEDAP